MSRARSILIGSTRIWLVLLAFTMAEVESWVHFFATAHEICAEHGELAHVDHHGLPDQSDDDDSSSHSGARLDRESPAPGEHEDDHCTLHRVAPATPSAASESVVVGEAPAAPAHIAPATPRASRVPIYHLAPKNSPTA
ncbi:MAG: hypothetical protein RL885_03915 [Planctomycetota bacterium]